MDLLEPATDALADVLERVVFLGGATVGLWLTDPAARTPRVTVDVDVVAEVTTLLDYSAFQNDLRGLGFAEDIESGVICRWRHADTGLVLDAVPLELRFAGLASRWLADAVQGAIERALPSGAVIRLVPAPWLLVTKLEAFADRGADDCLSSRDFEDIVLLVDGREELSDELNALPRAAIEYVTEQLARARALPTFEYGVEGALGPPEGRARAQAVTLPRLERLADGLG